MGLVGKRIVFVGRPPARELTSATMTSSMKAIIPSCDVPQPGGFDSSLTGRQWPEGDSPIVVYSLGCSHGNSWEEVYVRKA